MAPPRPIEGWFPNPYGGVEPIFAATARLAHWVHDDAELTFHLCYGDSKFGASPFMGDPPNEEAAARGGRHILPRDATAIVTLANGLSRHVQRRIDAIQAATVASWTKRAHWRPLADLALEADTEVFLGLLHAEDGAAGARARAAVAAEFLSGIRHLHRVWARQTFSGTTGSRPGRVAGVHHRARTSARHRIARGLT